jgi:TorA maturation chaperone TorD
MPSPRQISDGLSVNLARECLYRFLAAALSDPNSNGFRIVLGPANQSLARAAADLLREEASSDGLVLGFGELPVDCLDLESLVARLQAPLHQILAEYDRVFGLLVPRECPPYETEYHSTAEPFSRAQQLADIAGFYRAFGLDLSAAVPERPDHIALELEFMAFLIMKARMAPGVGQPNAAADQEQVCEEAQQGFFREHLAWWVPSFTAGLRRKAAGGVYAAVGELLAALLPLERDRFGIVAPRMPLEPALIERPEEQSGCNVCPATLGGGGIT